MSGSAPVQSETPDSVVPWRLRTDLELTPDAHDRSGGWVFKDPLRLTYFHVNDIELLFLRCLNGKRTYSEIAEMVRLHFPDGHLRIADLQPFLITSVQAGLLTSTTPGHGVRLAAAAARRPSLTRRLSSVLGYRWHGIDPTGLLDRIHPLLAWIFSPIALGISGAFVLTVTVLVLFRLDQLLTELPTLTNLLTWHTLTYLVLAVILIKGLHESGHALACRHFGGECHELGILFVAFIPLLYCDVSDSWSQSDRWRRMAVAAAGIFTELNIAALCGILWIFSHPGILHTFFLNVMIVCSVNTILINGNPLLRYDGYYVLSDLLRIPNLSAESRLLASAFLKRLIFGTPATTYVSRSPIGVTGLTLLGLASACYRVTVVGVILLFVYRTLQPWGLQILTAVPATTTIAGILLTGIVQTRQELTRSDDKPRAWKGLAVALVVTAFVLFIPWSDSISAPCLLTPGVSEPVYVRVAGRIEPAVEPGDSVRTGQILAVLHNPDLDLQIAAAEGEIHERESRLTSLLQQRTADRHSSAGLRVAEESLAAAQQRLQRLQSMRSDLTIRSPRDGIVLLPP
ncbi:MAG: hypothetical protein KDA85_08895, partial [Planctomycetaceae bacterium]|nr:hypothetical protein [Planctomycetaceae bacterium]